MIQYENFNSIDCFGRSLKDPQKQAMAFANSKECKRLINITEAIQPSESGTNHRLRVTVWYETP